MRTGKDGFGYQAVLGIITDIPKDTYELTAIMFGEDYSRDDRQRMSSTLNKMRKEGRIVRDGFRFRSTGQNTRGWIARWRLPNDYEKTNRRNVL